MEPPRISWKGPIKTNWITVTSFSRWLFQLVCWFDEVRHCHEIDQINPRKGHASHRTIQSASHKPFLANFVGSKNVYTCLNVSLSIWHRNVHGIYQNLSWISLLLQSCVSPLSSWAWIVRLFSTVVFFFISRSLLQ